MLKPHHAFVALLCLTGSATAQGQIAESFDVAVLQAPAPVRVDGGQRLLYEIHLTNLASRPLAISRIEVVDAATAARLAAYDEAQLKPRTVVIGSPDQQSLQVSRGDRVVVFVELELGVRNPAALRHVIQYAANDKTSSLTTASVPVAKPARLELGPPLRGGPWVAIYNYDWQRGHRRVFYTLEGRARLPGRFAIDWVKVDDQGRTEAGDADVPANAFGYGAEVLAVADATVIAVRSDLAESPTVSGNGKHSLADAAGNHVVLGLADGRFVIYEHLKPGSVTASVGSRVRRGQVIGALGFTGDSTGPHLHFHIADAGAPLTGEGLPYAFSQFISLGRYPDIANGLGSKPWEKSGPEQIDSAFPGPGVVIDFK
ncbi:murein DD-endopeptidase MepM/ murein hydrolase activator NlpD [Povalibacter uvarum]|uniref:Murein DD-endopeptidase MepM/ murein hydrolase activator NlpD n=1 Tax=Povalibacter uvarum TaxID=732238 RepID=A0A841HMQ2_9GAMM|nr:M23 family metallopeptidase [Povalibacter uvarum]MBB6093884.1 murein DD-endopeptidase MepM/ murein hydrolase activator NlpD [Povalibacter uvarum]